MKTQNAELNEKDLQRVVGGRAPVRKGAESPLRQIPQNQQTIWQAQMNELKSTLESYTSLNQSGGLL